MQPEKSRQLLGYMPSPCKITLFRLPAQQDVHATGRVKDIIDINLSPCADSSWVHSSPQLSFSGNQATLIWRVCPVPQRRLARRLLSQNRREVGCVCIQTYEP